MRNIILQNPRDLAIGVVMPFLTDLNMAATDRLHIKAILPKKRFDIWIKVPTFHATGLQIDNMRIVTHPDVSPHNSLAPE